MAFNYQKKNPLEYENVTKASNDLNSLGEYKSSDASLDAARLRDEHASNKVSDWTGGSYGESVKQAMDKINNREKFSYDLNGDALYQQYKDQYINQGRLAMADTIGQASAMTGGYGNSYAATAGNQAYQGYLQKLNDVVPELYQMAYDKYNQEGTDLYNQLSMYQNAYDTEYGEYRNKVADWNTEQNRLDQNAYNEETLSRSAYDSDRSYLASMYNTALDWATNDANTDYSNAFNTYQQQVSEDQWNKNFAEEQRQYDASLAENQRQFNLNYDLNKSSADQSAKIASLQSQVDSYKQAEEDEEEQKKTLLNRTKATSYSSSEALNKAVSAGGSSISLQLMALEAMWEAGNITEKQYKDLSYALKNPNK